MTSTIARYLLGIIFTVFGLNGFLQFLPAQPMASPVAGQFIMAAFTSHFMVPIFALQLIGGILLLAGRYVPLALTFLAGIILNILVFHATMDPKGIGPGVLVAILWILVFLRHKSSFAPLFKAQPE